MVGAAAAVTIRNGKCVAASVAIGGLIPAAKKALAVEAALVGKTLDPTVIAAAAEALQNNLGDDILEDIHAGVEYRKSMATVFVKRALSVATERAMTR